MERFSPAPALAQLFQGSTWNAQCSSHPRVPAWRSSVFLA
jgi:hypothetical protein